MKMSKFKKFSSLLLCLVLIAAMALTLTGCVEEMEPTQESTEGSVRIQENGQTVGEGSTRFTFVIVDADGNEIEATVCTDKTTVAEALLELGLVDGEDSEYGLYVKTVNGITLNYETDGKYWAFYIDGEYAMTGVDATDVVDGATYTFKAE